MTGRKTIFFKIHPPHRETAFPLSLSFILPRNSFFLFMIFFFLSKNQIFFKIHPSRNCLSQFTETKNNIKKNPKPVLDDLFVCCVIHPSLSTLFCFSFSFPFLSFFFFSFLKRSPPQKTKNNKKKKKNQH